MINKLKNLHEQHTGKISDKWSLYLDEWERIFTPFHNEPINLLEIGIQNGGSLEIWEKYFERAEKIIGCDIEPKCYQLKYEDNRIHIVIGDVNTDEVEKEISQYTTSFDIIIDDGSHVSSDIIKSFARYFPYLTDGGVYIAEDLHCSYWDFFDGSLFNPNSSMSFFKRLADIVNYEHWRNNKPRNYVLNKFAEQLAIDFDDLDLARIHSIEFVNSLCIIRKLPPSKNILGNRLIVGSEEKVTTSWYKHNGTSINDIVVDINNNEALDIFNLLESNENLTQTISCKEDQIRQIQRTIEENTQIIIKQKSLLDSKDSSINHLNQEISAFAEQIVELNKELVNQNSLLDSKESSIRHLDQEISALVEQIVELNKELTKNKDEVTSLHKSIEENLSVIESLNQRINENNLLAENKSFEYLDTQRKQIDSLTRIIDEQEALISNFRNSNSWKLTAPLRKLKNLRNPLKRDTVIATKKLNNQNLGCNAFFTICSKNFLAHARVLYKSIQPHYPNSRFFVVLCDKVDGLFDPQQEPFEFIYLEDLNLPNLEEMANRYNITEFNTAVKPFSFSYLFTNYGFDSVAYLDPDLFFIDKMEELDQMLSEGIEAILTPHILEPAENVEVDDSKMLIYGIYNLGFLALRNTKSIKTFLSWWERRLEHQCVIQLDKGLFVDQKWADLLPAFVSNTRILHHPGYNVAYWNLSQRKITKKDGKWYSNYQPLRFVHFSGNKIDDPNIFSRHSSEITVKSIGDLAILLNQYREKVYAEGHEFYRSFPYAYSWNGESGENLHTPIEYDCSVSNDGTLSTETINDKINQQNKLNGLNEIFSVATKYYGGVLPSTNKLLSAIKKKGWSHVKTKLFELKSYEYINTLRELNSIQSNGNTIQISQTLPITQEFKRRFPTKKGILYIDWGIPKPDFDAASLTAFQLLLTFDSLGYDTTFIPANLKYEENYYENLVEKGIEVICSPQIKNLEKWLEDNAHKFDICVLARGTVCWSFLPILKAHAPNLKLIFNTVDLHYLRELRQADITGDEDLRKSAIITKGREFDLIKQCDLTIVLSSEETYKIRETYPQAKLTVLPIIFDEIPGAINQFEERKDILFVGSFPHLPNIDAVIYFSQQIFPIIQKQIPEIKFKIIGANPPKEIQELAKNPSIEVMGFVRDLQPIFEGIKLSVAPLRYGAGIKGKIGTSFCYGVPCVGNTIAIEGMGLSIGHNILVGNTPESFAESVCKLYSDRKLWKSISKASHNFALENYSKKTLSTRVNGILNSVIENWKPIESVVEINRWDSFQKHSNLLQEEYTNRTITELNLIPDEEVESFHTSGYCCVCRKETVFLTSFMYSNEEKINNKRIPNWREHLQCSHCGFVNRIRASLNALFSNFALAENSQIYITEQLTTTYDWLKSKYPNIQGSEYFGNDIPAGFINNGIRNENIMNLSFNDSSFDYVLSFDVLEHVPYPEKAFKEIYRVLDKHGVFLFTVPFSADSQRDIIRAEIDEDVKVKHLMSPEFHGNPVDPDNGALYFRYFGWEMLETLRSIGFIRVRALAYWSMNQGYLGKEQYIFIAEKL